MEAVRRPSAGADGQISIVVPDGPYVDPVICYIESGPRLCVFSANLERKRRMEILEMKWTC